MKIRELVKGDNTIVLIVKEINSKETKTGKPYIQLSLSDGEKDIVANMWDMSATDFFCEVGEVASFGIKVGEYNGSENYTAIGYTKVDPTTVDLNSFIEQPPIPPVEMYNRILEVVKHMDNADVRLLTGNVLELNKEKLLTWGAAKAIHHNICGGLLYHMYRMMMQAQMMCGIYSLNEDILLSGTILHDIGKLQELQTDTFGNSEYTTDGKLFGHLYLGAQMVQKVASKLNTNSDVLKQILHIIVSHHGKQEMGAIVVPATTEAQLVHEIDMIDAKMYQFEKVTKDIESGEFSDKVFGLDNRRIYRP